jgi:hypothetical protein
MRVSARHGRLLLTCAALCAAVCSTVASAQMAGWIKAGSHPNDYEMGTDPNVAFTGKSSGFIRSSKPEPEGFGTYMQMFDASEYRGKRLKLSMMVKTDAVADWAGVWMRVDSDRKPGIAFDNMSNRPIKGTQAWTPYSVVLDIDPSAARIAFGILLAGKGSVWIDDVMFDIVGTEVTSTDFIKGSGSGPHNLSFEDAPTGR